MLTGHRTTARARPYTRLGAVRGLRPPVQATTRAQLQISATSSATRIMNGTDLPALPRLSLQTAQVCLKTQFGTQLRA